MSGRMDETEEEWVGGGKGNEQSEKRGKREQTRAERPGEEEKSRTDCDRCICA